VSLWLGVRKIKIPIAIPIPISGMTYPNPLGYLVDTVRRMPAKSNMLALIQMITIIYAGKLKIIFGSYFTDKVEIPYKCHIKR